MKGEKRKNFSGKTWFFSHLESAVYIEGKKGGETMPPLEYQQSCEKRFAAFCVGAIEKAAQNAFRELHRYSDREVSLSDITENDIYLIAEPEMFPSGWFRIANTDVPIYHPTLAAALEQLKYRQRSIILLYYIFGYTDLEIADFLEMAKSTVQYNRQAALDNLRDLMEEFS